MLAGQKQLREEPKGNAADIARNERREKFVVWHGCNPTQPIEPEAKRKA